MAEFFDEEDSPSMKKINVFHTKFTMSERNKNVNILKKPNDYLNDIIINDNEVFTIDEESIEKKIDIDNDHTIIISKLPIEEIENKDYKTLDFITSEINNSILDKNFQKDNLFYHCRSCMIFLTNEEGKF